MSRRRDERSARHSQISRTSSHLRRRARPLAVEGLEGRTLLSFGAAQAFGLGGGDLLSRATLTDAAGDVYLAGGFSGTVNFSPAKGSQVNLTSAGGRDAFLAKYTPTGSLAWAKSYGGTLNDVANALAMDAAGNFYLAGSFNGTAAFGTTSLTSAGSSDGFIAKLDPRGNVLWARAEGGAGYDQTVAVAVDAAGNVYSAGSFNGTADFDNTVVPGGGSYDAFVAKYSPTGTLAWAKDLGGAGSDGATAVAVDAAGNSYATGSFQGTANFGGKTLTSAGGNDGFVTKLDPTGNVVWANSFGGIGSDLGKAVALDAAGDAVVTGSFQNTAAFGTTTLTSNGGNDAFVAKYTPAGTLAWAQGFGGPSNDSGAAVAVDPTSGAVTIAGPYSAKMTLGSGTAATTLTSSGGTDVFVAGMDASGAFLWGKGYGGGGNDAATAVTLVPDGSGNVVVTGAYLGAVAFDTMVLPNIGPVNLFVARLANATTPPPPGPVAFGLGGSDLVSRASLTDAAGNLYLVGGFSGTVNFAPGNAPVVNLTSAGARDAFLAKYAPTGSLIYAKSFGGAQNDVANALAIDAAGNLYVAGSFNGTAAFGTTSLASAGSSDGFIAKLDPDGNVLWARDQGGAGYDQTVAVAVDAAGDVYTAGSFVGPATFGTTTLAGFGGYDTFVAKFSPTGAPVWAKDLGGAGADGATGLAVDAAGDAYATGSFQGSATFGGTTLTTVGPNAGFLAKLDPTGNVLWAQSFGGTGSDVSKAVALDAAGNAVVTGQFQNAVTFGTTTLTSNGLYDAFVAKYTPAGAVAWAENFGGPGNDAAAAVAVDPVSGAVTVVGQFSNSMTLGSGASATTLTSNGGTDIFVIGLDAAGKFVSAKSFGGSGNDTPSALGMAPGGPGNSILTGTYLSPMIVGTTVVPTIGSANIFVVRLGTSATPPPPDPGAFGLGGNDLVSRATLTDAAGNVYLAGGFTGTVNFAPGSATPVNLTSANGQAAFLAKYTSTGSLAWVKSFGGTLNAVADALAIDAAGNFALAGSFNGTATFGTTSLTSTGLSDGFVAKLDPSGNVLWVHDQDGAGFNQAVTIALDAAGDVYAAGEFVGPATFGTTTLAGLGGYDAFVAKYSPSGTLLWAKGLGGTGSDGATGLAVDALGDAYATGSFQGSAAFGGTTLTTVGANAGFLAKLDPLGNVLWAQSFGGTGSDVSKAVALDAAGDAVVTGQFQNSITFGTTTLTSNGLYDGFVAKYTPLGTLAWALDIGGAANDAGAAVTVDPVSGAVTVVGQFSGSMTLGSGASATTLTSNGGTDVFVLRLDASGNFVWAKSYGGSGNDNASAVALVSGGSGDVMITGTFFGTVAFDTSAVTATGPASIFVAHVKKPS